MKGLLGVVVGSGRPFGRVQSGGFCFVAGEPPHYRQTPWLLPSRPSPPLPQPPHHHAHVPASYRSWEIGPVYRVVRGWQSQLRSKQRGTWRPGPTLPTTHTSSSPVPLTPGPDPHTCCLHLHSSTLHSQPLPPQLLIHNTSRASRLKFQTCFCAFHSIGINYIHTSCTHQLVIFSLPECYSVCKTEESCSTCSGSQYNIQYKFVHLHIIQYQWEGSSVVAEKWKSSNKEIACEATPVFLSEGTSSKHSGTGDQYERRSY